MLSTASIIAFILMIDKQNQVLLIYNTFARIPLLAIETIIAVSFFSADHDNVQWKFLSLFTTRVIKTMRDCNCAVRLLFATAVYVQHQKKGKSQQHFFFFLCASKIHKYIYWTCACYNDYDSGIAAILFLLNIINKNEESFFLHF